MGTRFLRHYLNTSSLFSAITVGQEAKFENYTLVAFTWHDDAAVSSDSRTRAHSIANDLPSRFQFERVAASSGSIDRLFGRDADLPVWTIRSIEREADPVSFEGDELHVPEIRVRMRELAVLTDQ